MKTAVLLVTCASVVVTVSSYGTYQESLPNGDQVPHPCKPNFIWKGVGHRQTQGGGSRNSFGEDFAAAGHKWTAELCAKDSDGDGLTNGEELGDPDCVWELGRAPTKVDGISHPGICDPWGSPKCLFNNSWVKCDSEEFKCPPIHEEGVKKMEIRFPPTKVPAKETTYICMGFDLPSDGDYHLIATTPIINETRVMHHITLSACDQTAQFKSEPAECFMGLNGCTQSIGLWTLGLPGQCFNKDAGFRIGTRGMRKGVIQLHWTNPQERDDLVDASGMTIYYTKKHRKYDAGSWSTGQLYLEIPPQMPKVVQGSVCSSECTKRNINGSIFITTALNHMHYLGISQYIKIKRQDGTQVMLTNDEKYSYDSPVLHEFENPIEVRAGDSVETVCTYRSLSRKKTTLFGDGSHDEMCFGIFNYYPAQAMRSPTCMTRKNFDHCDLMDRGCNFLQISNQNDPNTRKLIDEVLTTCSYMGECLHGCRKLVGDIKTNNPCFKDGLAENLLYESFLKRPDNALEFLRFVTAMKSCDHNKENDLNYQPELSPVTDDNNASTRLFGSFLLIIVCMTAML